MPIPRSRKASAIRAGLLAAFLGTVASLAAAAEAGPERFTVHGTPVPLPDVSFRDGDGTDRSLASFRGRTVLLNVWATWCGPCRAEMPTLDRLQADLGGDSFEVVALSIDRAGMSVVRKFFDDIGIRHLSAYIDARGAAAGGLKVVGLPTTLLIDPQGREIGRLVGPAEWDSPAMKAFLRTHLALRPESGERGAPRDNAGVSHARDRWHPIASMSRYARIALDPPVTGGCMSQSYGRGENHERACPDR